MWRAISAARARLLDIGKSKVRLVAPDECCRTSPSALTAFAAAVMMDCVQDKVEGGLTRIPGASAGEQEYVAGPGGYRVSAAQQPE